VPGRRRRSGSDPGTDRGRTMAESQGGSPLSAPGAEGRQARVRTTEVLGLRGALPAQGGSERPAQVALVPCLLQAGDQQLGQGDRDDDAQANNAQDSHSSNERATPADGCRGKARRRRPRRRKAVQASAQAPRLALRLPAVFQVAGQELCQVDAADVAQLVELGAAGEAVGQHDRVLRGAADGGQQGGLGDGA
jgi:hypothetical protein